MNHVEPQDNPETGLDRMTLERPPIDSSRLFHGAPQLKHWARVFAVASLVHLTLPDFEQSGWMAPRIIEGLGALLLLWRPGLLGFGLCFIGTLCPLLFLRDVLTQSMLLTWMSLIGMYGVIRPGKDALGSVTWITAGTYWLAALHKVNTSFLNPEMSCAHHAWDQVQDHWWWLPQVNLDSELALGIIFIEIAIGVLLVRRSPWAWVLGVLFHLPLTVTLAPAFGAVMLAGYAASLTPRQIVILRRFTRTHWARWALAGITVATIEGVSLFPDLAIGPIMKCFVAGSLLAGFGALIHERLHVDWARPDVTVWTIFCLWVAHGLTPYVGIQYQHTAAMLSNLRIDNDCHNSLIFPSSLILSDPYIRIDSAVIGSGQRPKRETILESGLWSYPALSTMQENWCIEELRPIRLEGRFEDRQFLIEDLCAAGWRDALGGATSLPGFQRFQKNLERRCDAACVH